MGRWTSVSLQRAFLRLQTSSLPGIPKVFIYCLNVGIGRIPRIPPTLQSLFGQRTLRLREVRTGLEPQKMAAPLGLDLWVLKLGG